MKAYLTKRSNKYSVNINVKVSTKFVVKSVTNLTIKGILIPEFIVGINK